MDKIMQLQNKPNQKFYSYYKMNQIRIFLEF